MWLISVSRAGFLTLCCTHHSPERTPEPPHSSEGGAVPLAVNRVDLQSSSSVVCLHLLPLGRLFSARSENIRTHLPVLPPAPAMPAAGRERRAALPAVRTVTPSLRPAAGLCFAEHVQPHAGGTFAPAACGSWQAFQGAALGSQSCLFRSMLCFCLGLQLPVSCCTNTALSPISPWPLLPPQPGSLRCSGLATPQLGKQELILPHQPGALQPQLPQAKSAPLFFSQVNLPFIIQQI